MAIEQTKRMIDITMCFVTEYLGCELIRNRAAQTAKPVQKGYVEQVLRTFGMKKKENTPRVCSQV
jgi:hypothetical protein